jgi:hypothetical protein
MDSQATQFFLGFIQDTVSLKILVADYNSFFVNISFGLERIKDKAKQEEEIAARFSKLSEQDKSTLLNLLNNIRRIAFSLQIDLKSMESSLGLSKEETDALERDYKEIEEVSLPDYKKCKSFLQSLNDIKIKHIDVQALIITQEKEERAMKAMQTPRGVSL